MRANDPRDGAFPPGSLISDRYKVVERLGGGGFGTVYHCRDTRIGRHLAVKVLKLDESAPNPLAMQELRRRFLQEATAAGQIHHQSVINVFDVNAVDLPDGSSHLLIAMQLLAGKDLETYLLTEGPMSPTRFLPLFIEACRGLGEGHSKGIVHKDLKPANLILHAPDDAAERLVVVDFGIASVLHEERLTATGNLIGTPHYLAPEYIERQIVTPRFDVYQLGLILAEILTGETVIPATASFIDACGMHVAGTLSFPQELMNGPLGRVLERACARRPEDRFASAAELADALEAIDPASIQVKLDRSFLPTIPHLQSPMTMPISAEVARQIAADRGAGARERLPQTAHFFSSTTGETIRAELEEMQQAQKTGPEIIEPGVVPKLDYSRDTLSVEREFDMQRPMVSILVAIIVVLIGALMMALMR